MNKILVKLWRIIKGPLQWYVLWFFHNKFIVGVSGIILNNNKEVLLLRHVYWKEDSWGLPSGYAIKNETFENTLKREVKEETNLDIEVKQLIRLVSGYKLRAEVNLLAHLVGGELVLDKNEIIDAKFFPLNSLPSGILDSHQKIIDIAVKSII